MRRVVLFAGFCLVACGGSGEAPPRSPSTDYVEPQARTSNGEVVGADREPPGDKLAESPRIGSGGITPASTPPHGEPNTPTPPPPPPKTPPGR
ncbi:MAG TPA: hypothetical protein VHE30_22520 [Polyangiaceae bacterium]|nr:hypothetical protein [Polyangiaceae bacterium]